MSDLSPEAEPPAPVASSAAPVAHHGCSAESPGFAAPSSPVPLAVAGATAPGRRHGPRADPANRLGDPLGNPLGNLRRCVTAQTPQSPPAAAPGPVIRRQLTLTTPATLTDPDAYTDSRDLGGTVFTHVAGHVYSSHGGTYRYRYDPARRLYLVTAGPTLRANLYWDVQHGRELVKHDVRSPATGQWYFYFSDGTRRYFYDDAAHEFKLLTRPTGAQNWADGPVDLPRDHRGEDRLVTEAGAIRKQYVIGTLNQLTYVMPVKLPGERYMPGLPTLAGGNMSPGDDPTATVKREAEEELHKQYTLDTATFLADVSHGDSDMKVHTADLRTPTLHERGLMRPPKRVETRVASFQFKASELEPASNSLDDVKQALLTLFLAKYPGAVPPSHTVRGDFMASGSIGALAGHAGTAHTDYVTAMTACRGGVPLGLAPTPQERAAYDDYAEGFTVSRAAGPPDTRREQAYKQARADYALGLTDVRAGTAVGGHLEPAYVGARADYALGLTEVRAGTAAGAHAEPAYTGARTDYALGLSDLRAGIAVGAHVEPAYTEARTDYALGLADERAGTAAGAHAEPAYVGARADYTAGTDAKEAENFDDAGVAGYADAGRDYDAGLNAAALGTFVAHAQPIPAYNTAGGRYLLGYGHLVVVEELRAASYAYRRGFAAGQRREDDRPKRPHDEAPDRDYDERDTSDAGKRGAPKRRFDVTDQATTF